MTLQLLWHEYKEKSPEGYQYSQFCRIYRQWAEKLDPCLRQEYRAGEKLFVDYARQTMGITDPKTGEIHEAQIFVATFNRKNWPASFGMSGQNQRNRQPETSSW